MTVMLTAADAGLDRVLSIVADRLMVDPDWITGDGHTRRPQAAFARRMFCFAATYYTAATQRQVASYLDVDDRTVSRLLRGYRDVDGVWQPGAAALVQSHVDWYELALHIREEIQHA